MSQVTKRTGESINFAWTFPSAQEPFIDGFRLENAPAADGPWSVAIGISKFDRTAVRSASVHEFYRVLSTFGALAAAAVEIVEVLIDNTPPAPTNFNAS